MNEAIMAFVVAVVMGLFKIIDYFITKKNGADKEKDPCLSKEEHEYLKSLYDWHNINDDDGRKIWYIPKSVSESQKEMTVLMREIGETQKDMAQILERIISRMDKI